MCYGEISVEEAGKELRMLTIEIIENAVLDIHRKCSRGIPEVVLGEGKEARDIVEIVKVFVERNGYALVTRINNCSELRSQLKGFELDYNEKARTLLIKKINYSLPKNGKVGILAAGTVDIPVAEEVKVASNTMDCEVFNAYDVGIAALHRVFEP